MLALRISCELKYSTDRGAVPLVVLYHVLVQIYDKTQINFYKKLFFH